VRKVAIVQSNYIPWKGYFDLIAAVDEFILYDDAQFTKNDWRNRNQIKTPTGLQWLSIPVGKAISRRIRDVRLSTDAWRQKHWKTLHANYARAIHYKDVADHIRPIYLQGEYIYLTDFNRALIEAICRYLGIRTKITNSWDYQLIGGKTERLIDLCRQANASIYVSGPAAKKYLDEHKFTDAGIQLCWFEYPEYPQYNQLWGEFVHGVSILDLLFACGAASVNYMAYPRYASTYELRMRGGRIERAQLIESPITIQGRS
jgi:hypothetical protein